MTGFLLEGETDYEIYFSHQTDKRSFNRGAMKNIGFMAIREKYPEHYKDIDFVFNDVDTIPFHKIFTYSTSPGVVKHYYGFRYALGGIVVIKGADFERVNGYPNFWGWGNEDNCLQARCLQAGLRIDRSQFYEIGSPHILQLFDGISRIISKKDYTRFRNDKGIDGLQTIHRWMYTIDDESAYPEDNEYKTGNARVFFVNTTAFMTAVPYEAEEYYHYDLRDSPKKIVNPDRQNRIPGRETLVTTDQWKNIPYVPTLQEKRSQEYRSQEYRNQEYRTQEKRLDNRAFRPNLVQRLPHPTSSSGPKATKSANIGMGGVKAFFG
jgi:hypothetical protein